MTSEALFRLVLDEAARDGVYDAEENRILQRVAVALGIAPATAMTMAREALARHAAGELGVARPLEPDALMRAVVRAAWADGHVDDDEREIMRKLRDVLYIPG